VRPDGDGSRIQARHGHAASDARRRKAWRFGRRAERLCAWWLRLKGYQVVCWDMRTPAGEIDLIARRGGTLAIVEVKARLGGMPEEALSPRQRRRIVRATEAFLQGRPDLAGLDVRFDVMLVGAWPPVRHLAGAFRSDD
jgi:putative endonuclease